MAPKQTRLDFAKDYILEDAFVKLIPLGENHIPPLAEISDDPDIWRYLLENGNSTESLATYVRSAIENRAIEKEYPFAIFEKKNGRYAGTTRFYEYSPELKTIKLGHTWYGRPFRGSGLNKRCKYLLFEFAFEQLDIERIGFGSYATNTISIAAMKSVGCKKEGVLRNIFPALDGKGRTDAILMSILKNEWHEHVKTELADKINV